MLRQFDYLAESKKLNDDDISDFKRLKNETYLCDPNNQNAVINSLERLCFDDGCFGREGQYFIRSCPRRGA